MGSTVIFHNGFGDYVINRGALALLAVGLPQPVRLVYGAGPHEFLVRDLPFASFQAITFSGPNGGRGRTFDLPPSERGQWSDILVNLCSWDGVGMERLRDQLQPARYVWNTAWKSWDEEGANAVEMAFETVREALPATTIDRLRQPPQFEAGLESAVEQMLGKIKSQGFKRYICLHLDCSKAKNWPVNVISDVVCTLLAEHDDLFVLIVGQADHLRRCHCHEGRIVFLGGFSLQASMSVVAKSTAFVGVDSCMMKIADVFGIPGAAIFDTRRGASRWGYYWTKAEHVVMDETTATGIAHRLYGALSSALTSPISRNPNNEYF